MIRWLLIGAGVGGGVSAVLAIREGKKLKEDGAMLQAALTSRGGEMQALLHARGEAFRDEVSEQAEAYATSLANQTARDVLAIKYGLTPEFVARMKTSIPRVASRLATIAGRIT